MPEDDSRPHAIDIYERIIEDSAEELERAWTSLAFSGLFAGFAIGLAPLAVALATTALGDTSATTLVAALLYPVGYVAVILGRAQFFTENTLYPVMLTVRRHEFLLRSMRLWVIVLATNLLGAVLFALLAGSTSAVDSKTQEELISTGISYADSPTADAFFASIITGFILAFVAWLVEASDTAGARIAVIWSLTFLVALGSFDHCIASTVAVVTALFEGGINFGETLTWWLPVLAGNIVGGVLIVTSINYGQIREEEEEEEEERADKA